jgi:hypothetical protein
VIIGNFPFHVSSLLLPELSLYLKLQKIADHKVNSQKDKVAAFNWRVSLSIYIHIFFPLGINMKNLVSEFQVVES